MDNNFIRPTVGKSVNKVRTSGQPRPLIKAAFPSHQAVGDKQLRKTTRNTTMKETGPLTAAVACDSTIFLPKGTDISFEFGGIRPNHSSTSKKAKLTINKLFSDQQIERRVNLLSEDFPFRARSNGPSLVGNKDVVEMMERTLSSINLSKHDDASSQKVEDERQLHSNKIREPDN